MGLGPDPPDLRLLATLYSSVPRGRFQETCVTEGFGVIIGLLRWLGSSGALVVPRRASGEVGGAMEAGVVLGVAGLAGASSFFLLDFLLPGFVSISELTLASNANGSPSFFCSSPSEPSCSSGVWGRSSLRGGGCQGAEAAPDAGLRCCR